MLEEHLKTAQNGIDLTVDQMQQAILWMLSGQVSDQQISDLLVALAAKGESVSELVGAARALRLLMFKTGTDSI